MCRLFYVFNKGSLLIYTIRKALREIRRRAFIMKEKSISLLELRQRNTRKVAALFLAPVAS